ncbi:S24 family peptidase [Candidatus Roizmanbacteria bacterium]|nr:S24 family peptidase [Candidatus Roizmanbacteria bacterium]
MNKANIDNLTINDGDYVLVDTSNKQPNNGDYVLSIIDNCANIKKFIQKDKNQIALISESSEDFEPIYISEVDRYFIGRVVTQVIKKAN